VPDPLKKYRQMRNFGVTPEPSGGKRKRGKLPIFVIQKHQASRLHYDFRLEMEDVLKSWAVPRGPSYDPSQKRLAMMTEDHPYDYATFEGMIPAGNYGAGNVIIWDQGTWEFIEPGDDPVKALASGKLTFKLYGKKMFGEWALVKIKGRSPKGNEWLLIKHRDAYANDKIDVTEVAPQSVVSGKLVEEVGAGRIWQSNRPASSSKARTIADKLTKDVASAPRRAGAAAKTTAEGSSSADATSRRRDDAPRSKSSRSSRSPAAPSRAASARSRSSRAESPRKARPTPRRRPR
jgi:bifunctional non-homologous end joining protein LigD